MGYLASLYNQAKKKVGDYFQPTSNVRLRDVARELTPRNFSRNLMQAKPFDIGANSQSTMGQIGGGIVSGLLNPLIHLKDFSVEAANRGYGVPEKSKSQLAGMGLQSGLDIAGIFMGGGAGANLAKNAASRVTPKLIPTVSRVIGQGAKQGLKYGAGFGGAYGLSEGLKQGSSALETAKKTLYGTAIGGASGGLLGGGIPAVSALGKAAIGSVAGKLFRTADKYPYFSQTSKQVAKSLPVPGMSIKDVSGTNPLIQEAGKYNSAVFDELGFTKGAQKTIIPIKSNGKIVGGIDASIKNGYPDTLTIHYARVLPESQGKGAGTEAVSKLFKDNPKINYLQGHATAESKSFWKKQGATFSGDENNIFTITRPQSKGLQGVPELSPHKFSGKKLPENPLIQEAGSNSMQVDFDLSRISKNENFATATRKYGKKKIPQSGYNKIVQESLDKFNNKYKTNITLDDYFNDKLPTESQILNQSKGLQEGKSQIYKDLGEPTLNKPSQIVQDLGEPTLTPKTPVEPPTGANLGSQEQPISKFSQRVSETNPKVPQVEYTQSATDDVLSKAKANLDMGSEFALKQARNSSLGAESNATAMALLDDAIQKGNWETVDSLAKEFSPRFSKQGQEIQILSRWGRLSPAGAVNYTQHLIDKAKQASKVNIEFTPQAKKEIVSLAKNVQKTVEGTRERALSSALLMKKISEQIPSGIGRKISTIQTMAQLLNPKTAVRNIVGNLGFAGGEIASDIVGTPIDMATSIFTGKRTKTLPSFITQGKGFWKGLKEGTQEAMLGVDVKNLPSQFDIQNTPTFRGKIGQGFEKALGVELKATDRAFYQAAFDDSLRQQMTLNKVSKATPEMNEIAHNDALYRTFQDDSNASKLFSMIKKGLNLGKDFGLGDIVLKYPKTPGNLIGRALDYSPAGYAKAIMELAQPAFGKQFNQKGFVEALSRGTVGSAGLLGLGVMLQKMGVISGKPEKDTDINALQRTQGGGGYRLNASALKRLVLSGFNTDKAKQQQGDKLVTYDWFQPFAVPISMGANIANSGKVSLGENKDIALESLSAGANTLIDQPLVQGIKRMFGYGDLLGGLSETAKGIPSSFIPTFLNQIKQFTDNQTRETRGGGKVNEAMALVKNKIPGLAGTLPEKYDVLGNKQETYQGGSNSLFNVFLNPAFVSTLNETPVGKEVMGIFERSGEKQQAPRSVPKKVTINGGSLELSGQQISDYQKYVGEKTNSIFNSLLSNPKFTSLDDTEKAKQMANLLTDINSAAKIELFGNKPASVSKRIESIINGGELLLTGEKLPSKAKPKTSARKASVAKQKPYQSPFDTPSQLVANLRAKFGNKKKLSRIFAMPTSRSFAIPKVSRRRTNLIKI